MFFLKKNSQNNLTREIKPECPSPLFPQLPMAPPLLKVFNTSRGILRLASWYARRTACRWNGAYKEWGNNQYSDVCFYICCWGPIFGGNIWWDMAPLASFISSWKWNNMSTYLQWKGQKTHFPCSSKRFARYGVCTPFNFNMWKKTPLWHDVVHIYCKLWLLSYFTKKSNNQSMGPNCHASPTWWNPLCKGCNASIHPSLLCGQLCKTAWHP